jgi:hypothetical protein
MSHLTQARLQLFDPRVLDIDAKAKRERIAYGDNTVVFVPLKGELAVAKPETIDNGKTIELRRTQDNPRIWRKEQTILIAAMEAEISYKPVAADSEENTKQNRAEQQDRCLCLNSHIFLN